MKVAITGGAGQLGTLVLRRLMADPQVHEIVCVDRREPTVCSPKLRAVTADIQDVGIAGYFHGCEALFHFAFLVTENAPHDVYWGVNVDGSKNVFHAAAAAGVKTVVYSSSVAAYGVTPGHSLPMVEDTPRRYVPEFAYSATKFEVEAFLDAFEPAHPEMTFARLRPTILIGTHMDHTLGPLIRRNTLVLPDAAPLPIVWDEDVADAALLAMHQRARGAFNLSADEPLVASKLAKAAGMRSFRVPRTVARAAARMAPAFARVGLGKSIDPAWAAAMEVSIAVSSDRAKRQLGWNPSCPTSGDVFRRYVHVASQGLDLRLGLLLRAAKLYTSPLPEEHQGAHVLVHVALTGEHGGDLTLALERGQNRVVVSQIPRPPASTVTLPASLLLDLLAGRGTLEQALREGTVQWEGASVGTVALAAVVEGFRASQDAAGARRVLCRAVARCL